MSAMERLDPRLLELLADHATGDLATLERDEFDRLLASSPDAVEDAGLDMAIGALAVAFASEGLERMPAAVKTGLVARGRAEVASRGAGLAGEGDRGPIRIETRRTSGWMGWVAAAAAASVALVIWLTRPTPPVVTPAPPVPTLAEQRENLLNDPAGDTLEIAWTPNAEFAPSQGVSGDLVWNTRLQRGFMRFRGLAVNDPTQMQYQLWIFDGNRPQEYPIDGGVFDIEAAQIDPQTGDVLVPIEPKLQVFQPGLFAVTQEQPGGVVVTDRQRILVLAPVGG